MITEDKLRTELRDMHYKVIGLELRLKAVEPCVAMVLSLEDKVDRLKIENTKLKSRLRAGGHIVL